MAEVLVHEATTLRRHGDAGAERCRDAHHPQQGLLAGPLRDGARPLHRIAPLGAQLPRVPRRTGCQLREREGVEAVLAEPADRIGAALAAVAHQLRVEFAGPLHHLELLRGRPALAGHAVMRAVLGRGDERDEVHDERPRRADRPDHLREVLVVHAGNDDRVHLHEDAPLAQARDPEELPLGEDARRLAAADLAAVADDPLPAGHDIANRRARGAENRRVEDIVRRLAG